MTSYSQRWTQIRFVCHRNLTFRIAARPAICPSMGFLLFEGGIASIPISLLPVYTSGGYFTLSGLNSLTLLSENVHHTYTGNSVKKCVLRNINFVVPQEYNLQEDTRTVKEISTRFVVFKISCLQNALKPTNMITMTCCT